MLDYSLVRFERATAKGRKLRRAEKKNYENERQLAFATCLLSINIEHNPHQIKNISPCSPVYLRAV